MNGFGGFKEKTDVNDLNSNGRSEISNDAQDKFDKLMGDDKIQECRAEEQKSGLFDKVSIGQKFEKLFDKQESCDEPDSEDDVFIDILDEEQSDNRRLPRNGGEWSGEPGDSEWNPDSKLTPGDRNGTNPEGKSWKEIKKEYKFDTITFEDGKPDFSEVSKGNVEIDNFSENRRKNFVQADEKLAEQKGCSPSEVKEWRTENKYTWHEEADCKTMRKVPSEVHGNIPHDGGISEIKSLRNS